MTRRLKAAFGTVALLALGSLAVEISNSLAGPPGPLVTTSHAKRATAGPTSPATPALGPPKRTPAVAPPTQASPGVRVATPGAWPVTSWHYAANGNFAGNGLYLPGADGFNLADVSSVSDANALPAGAKALVWVGTCDGASAAFQSLVNSFAASSRVFGFYLMDEPYASSCPAAHLKAESDWIHHQVPRAKTFVILVNVGSSVAPTFAGTYTPANSGLDLVGLDPYPVRTERSTPDYASIARYAAAAESAGWPRSSLVPVYQAFGAGTEVDDAGGHWKLPTTTDELTILAQWAAVTPTPAFDYAYSWGTQFGDDTLGGSAALQALFRQKQAVTR